MATLLSGETIAEQIIKKLEKQSSSWRIKNPKLLVVQVGDNLVSEKYIQEKEKIAERIGISFEILRFKKGTSQKKVQAEIEKAGKDSKISGIIVQLPLPATFQRQDILNAIPVSKDVDVLSHTSFGLFALGELPILPPTVKAIAILFKRYRIELQGKQVVVVGAGRLVGLPIATWLLGQKARVTVVDKSTKNLADVVRQADIIISGVGKTKLIKAAMIKKGAVVIDAGSSVAQGKITGDVDFNNVIHKAKFITPVPGGVGPLTVACLFENVVDYSTRSFI